MIIIPDIHVNLKNIEDEKFRNNIKEYICDEDEFNIYSDGDYVVIEGGETRYEINYFNLDPLRISLLNRLRKKFSIEYWEEMQALGINEDF